VLEIVQLIRSSIKMRQIVVVILIQLLEFRKLLANDLPFTRYQHTKNHHIVHKRSEHVKEARSQPRLIDSRE
jgi:hypothetical protein